MNDKGQTQYEFQCALGNEWVGYSDEDICPDCGWEASRSAPIGEEHMKNLNSWLTMDELKERISNEEDGSGLFKVVFVDGKLRFSEQDCGRGLSHIGMVKKEELPLVQGAGTIAFMFTYWKIMDSKSSTLMDKIGPERSCLTEEMEELIQAETGFEVRWY